MGEAFAPARLALSPSIIGSAVAYCFQFIPNPP